MNCPMCGVTEELKPVENVVCVIVDAQPVCVTVKTFECMGCGTMFLIEPPVGPDVYALARETL